MNHHSSNDIPVGPAGNGGLPPPAGINLNAGDILYILFRHKWKILILGVLGVLGGAAVIKLFPKSYASQARLFIRYVQEENKPGPAGEGAIKSLSTRGEAILSGEVAILTSLDIAQRVADTFGPEKIIAPAAKPATPADPADRGKAAEPTENSSQRLNAAAIISNGLQVEIANNSSVLELTFLHENPAIVQPLLSLIIDTYLKRHLEIHRPGATFDDAFVQQTDQLKARLSQTEQELLRARNSVGIISLEEARKTSAERINQLRNGIMQAEAEIAERKAMLKRLAEATGTAPTVPAAGETTETVDVANLPLTEYQSLSERYALVRNRQQEMRLLFTPESPRMQAITAQVADLLAQKSALEKAHPGLLRVAPAVANAQRSSVAGGAIDPVIESARLAALETRVEIFKNQLQQVREESAAVDKVEVTIQDLQRRKALEETNYSYFAATIEQSRINEALGAGRVTNINQVQTPSPPSLVASKSTKYAMVCAAAGFALGVAWAFLIELFLDRSIKRPVDVRRHLGLNLFLSIPHLKNRRRLRVSDPNAPLLGAGEKAPDLPHGGASNEIAPWEPEQDMHAYFDTLRDRVIGFFESENLTHKPKLIALAGVGKNGGDTDVAAGLASSLSETEDGNVLFVDMTAGQGSTQQFFKGQAVNSIDEALNSKEKAQVQDKLFVVTEVGKGDKLPRALPMRFNHLIPKLKASDFDYIIFNMPPVSPISITPRLAGFMDIVLLVVESEKSNRDMVTQARDLLSESGTPIGAVLTNTKSYIPKMLGQDAAD